MFYDELLRTRNHELLLGAVVDGRYPAFDVIVIIHKLFRLARLSPRQGVIHCEFLSVSPKYIFCDFIRELFTQLEDGRRASLGEKCVANHREESVAGAFIIYEIKILIPEILLNPQVGGGAGFILAALHFGLFFGLKRENGCAG